MPFTQNGPGASRRARRSRSACQLLDPALADAGGLAAQGAQVVQLGAAHPALAHHLDALQHGRMQREGTLHADAARDLADLEGLAHTAVLAADADALEGLDTLLVTLAHADVHADGVAGTEAGDVVPQVLLLGLDERMHERPFLCACERGWAGRKRRLRFRSQRQ